MYLHFKSSNMLIYIVYKLELFNAVKDLCFILLLYTFLFNIFNIPNNISNDIYLL